MATKVPHRVAVMTCMRLNAIVPDRVFRVERHNDELSSVITTSRDAGTTVVGIDDVDEMTAWDTHFAARAERKANERG